MTDTSWLDRLTLIFCRLWLAGQSPWVPGTCGSLVAVLLAPVCFFPLPLAGRIGLLIALFVLGVAASYRAERLLGHKDPRQIVIDELVGQWLVFLPLAVWSPLNLAAGLVLFRIFDIAKPWPIKWAEKRFPGGFGIMIDDLLAGIYAMILLVILEMILGRTESF